MASFPLFGRLPYELRTQIWAEATAAIEPREVEVRVHMVRRWKNNSVQNSSRSVPSCWVSLTPAPAILHACHEAREQGVRRYQRAFEASGAFIYTHGWLWVQQHGELIRKQHHHHHHHHHHHRCCASHYVWIDRAVDLVYARASGGAGFTHLVPPPETPLLRHLKLDVHDARDFAHRGHRMFIVGGGADRGVFPALERLHLVMHADGGFDHAGWRGAGRSWKWCRDYEDFVPQLCDEVRFVDPRTGAVRRGEELAGCSSGGDCERCRRRAEGRELLFMDREHMAATEFEFLGRRRVYDRFYVEL